MTGRKQIKTRGKISLSRYFQSLKEGDSVAVIQEKSVSSSFPDRLQGRTGVVAEKRGRSYVIKIKEYDKEKKFIIEPIHLKKIKN
ncbi:MAG: 50S ribosomal protein L21e [Candidatus Pacearchaeota archaeon]|nr:50S ribosomal protein L21e [Candidatus Pacearchaeota archaeon]